MSKKDAKINVLILSPFFRPNVGGVETHLTDLTDYLRKRNYHVSVLTYTPLTTRVKNVHSREHLRNLDINRIKWIGYDLFLKFEPYPLLEALYLIPPLLIHSLIFLWRNKIDVIHAHGIAAATIARILSKFFRIRLIMSIHGIYNLERRPIFSKFVYWVLSRFNKVLALALRSKEDFVNAGIPKEKIWISTQWVNQSIFRPQHKRTERKRELGLEKDFTVLFVGRLIKSKGVYALLKVAEMSPKEIKYLFIGTGPAETKIQALAKTHSNIKFIGKIPLELLVKYYGSVDIVVVPTQNEEGFARVVLEALSSGSPVFASNRGCLPEMIDPSVGRLFEPTPKDIFSHIIHFYENPKLLETLSRNCRPYALERFSEKNGILIEDAYRGH